MTPFGPQFDRYYRNIFAPAISRSGLKPLRGDSIFGPSAIVSDIWDLLKQSTMALAELTGRNPNVFYELGLAHAVGKPVIMVTSNNDDIPFDLRGLRVIVYDKDDEDWGIGLQKAIERSITEIRADPIRAVPATFSNHEAQACLVGDPLQLEIRQLAEEVRAMRLGGMKLAGAISQWGSSMPREIAETILAVVFPRARAIGLSWGQARHVIELTLAGKDGDALSYIEATGVARSDAEPVLGFIRDNCRM